MKLQIPRSDLLAALATVKPAAHGKTSLPILGCVLLSATDKALTCTATNLDQVLKARAGGTITTPGSLAVNCALLHDIVKRVTGDVVELALTESGQSKHLQLSCGSASFQLDYIVPDEFPPPNTLKNAKQFKVEDGVLRDVLAHVAFAISGDETRYVLNSVHLELSKGVLSATATDGRRVGRYGAMAKTSTLDCVLLLPTTAVQELLGLLDPAEKKPLIVTVEAGENGARFNVGDRSLTTKVIDGKYPNIKGVIPVAKDKEFTRTSCAELLSCVERVALVSSAVLLDLSAGSMLIQSVRTKESRGTAADALLTACAQTAKMQLGTRFLIDALKAAPEDDLEFFMSADGRMLLMHSDGGEWLCVIAGQTQVQEEDPKPAAKDDKPEANQPEPAAAAA